VNPGMKFVSPRRKFQECGKYICWVKKDAVILDCGEKILVVSVVFGREWLKTRISSSYAK
jgi:hypothetical protein